MKSLSLIVLCAIVLGCATSQALAGPAVFQVTTTSDNPASPVPCAITSDPGVYTCLTLRDAIVAANSTPGHDTIAFARIDRTDGANNCSIAVGDVDRVCKITISGSAALPAITDSITIDGEIAEGRGGIPGSVGNPGAFSTRRPGIELSGEALPLTPGTVLVGLRLIGADDTTIKGLVINRFPGPGILGQRSSNVNILGNYVGTDVTGTAATTWTNDYSSCLANCYGNRGTQGFGILIGQGDNITVGGHRINERNVTANNFATGISLFEATNSSITGNFSGTDVYGLSALGNRNENVEVRGFTGASRTILGLLPLFGTDVGSADNRIDHNLAVDSKTRAGIRLLGREMLFKTSPSDPGAVIPNAIENTTVVNNLSGINLNGQPVPNFQSGLNITDHATGSNVGFDLANGQLTPAPNVFAYNPNGGIVINTAAQPVFVNNTQIISPSLTVVEPVGNSVLYNIIHGNTNPTGGLGIDLAGLNLFNGDGVTANDPLDVDTGANNLQNFPLLTGAKTPGRSNVVIVGGSLESTPDSHFLLQVFASDEARSATVEVVQGTGLRSVFLAQGRRYLASLVVTTDSSGIARFSATLLPQSDLGTGCRIDGGSPVRACITATATSFEIDPGDLGNVRFGDTSEYSPAVVVRWGSQRRKHRSSRL